MSGELEIRRLESVDALRACEDLQKEVWGYTDREVVPKNELLAAVKSGGSLLGVYEGETLVACAYAMAGWDGREAYLSSRLVAVREGLRGRGVGERIKRAQREHALELGYKKIRWTQDALQAANARLNFHKLGATARSYVVDYYGSTTSPLHGALPTDRLEVEWELAETPPRATPTGCASLLDATEETPPRPAPRELLLAGDAVSIAVPPSLAACLAHDKELALAWRLATRTAFQRAFAAGFRVIDFDGRYLLSR